MATFRKRRVGFLFFLFFLLILYSYSRPSEPRYTPNLKTQAIDNYALGNWRPRSTGPVKTLDGLSAIHPNYPWQDGNCPGGLERIYNIVSWEWAGADGSVLPWDARRFIVDVLRREGGLLLVGDSLTSRQYLAITIQIQGFYGSYHSHIRFALESSPDTLADGQTLRKVLMVNPLHPAVESLLEEAGVGIERLERPFMTFMRNDYLGATPEVVDQACLENGAEFNWGAQHLLYDWLSIAKAYTTKPSPHRTLLILNTGLHWGMSPFVDRKNDDDLVYSVVNSIVQASYKSLSEIPNLQVVVRTSYPGERNCANITEPFTDMSQADTSIFGWHRVPHFNTILKDNIPLLEPARGVDSDRPLVLDIERQGTLRADARERPESDCLHMCPMAISDEWTRWAGMVMIGEERAGWGA